MLEQNVEEILQKIMQFEEVVNNPNHAGNEYFHLKGVYSLINSWESSINLQKAALCHNAYDIERPSSFSHRAKVQELIGIEAENLVYLFCALCPTSIIKALSKSSIEVLDLYSNSKVVISENDFAEIVTLALANWLEQRPRLPLEAQDNFKEAFIAAQPYLPQKAFIEFQKAYHLI